MWTIACDPATIAGNIIRKLSGPGADPRTLIGPRIGVGRDHARTLRSTLARIVIGVAPGRTGRLTHHRAIIAVQPIRTHKLTSLGVGITICLGHCPTNIDRWTEGCADTERGVGELACGAVVDADVVAGVVVGLGGAQEHALVGRVVGVGVRGRRASRGADTGRRVREGVVAEYDARAGRRVGEVRGGAVGHAGSVEWIGKPVQRAGLHTDSIRV